MNKKLILLVLLLVSVGCVIWSGGSVKSQEDMAITKESVVKPVSSTQPEERPTPKPNRCKRCVESELQCVEKNDKGECIRWKDVCKQWETYPC